MRAAVLHGPGDLRVEDVPEPVPGRARCSSRSRRPTTCGTDVKTWRRGHPKLAPSYPARFGHEMAGRRLDTGERVLVGDSRRLRRLPAVRGRPAADLPRAALGRSAASRERLAAPAAALHPVPDGLDAAGAAMAEPLAAAVHAVARAPARPLAPDAGVLGGGPMGQMLAALLVAEGRTVTLADRHPERRAQAEALGATGAERLADHDVVFEAVGRPEAWRAAVEALRARRLRRARRRLRGRQRRRRCRPARCTTTRSTCAAPSTTRRAEVDEALRLLAGGAVDWRALAAGPIGLDELPEALAAARRRAGAQVGRRARVPDEARPSDEERQGPAAALPAGAPAQVLDDPLGVRDRLVAEQQHRHARLARELVDLGAAARAAREPDLLVLDPVAAQLARDAAARAQPVRRRPAAVQARAAASVRAAGRRARDTRAQPRAGEPQRRAAGARRRRSAVARGARIHQATVDSTVSSCGRVRPAELAPRLGGAVGPVVRGGAHLGRRASGAAGTGTRPAASASASAAATGSLTAGGSTPESRPRSANSRSHV